MCTQGVLALLALCSLSVLSGASSVAVDRWLLDGHGCARFEFAGAGSAWTTSLKGVAKCYYPAWSTPFSGYEADGGSVIRATDGTLHVALVCGDDSKPHIWALDAMTGTHKAIVAVNHSSWDSYLKYLPDGSLAAGMDESGVAVFDNETLVEKYFTSDILAGDGGAQVLAVTKTSPPQLVTAGGDGGPDWWGAACDLPHPSADGRSYPFSRCAGNSDSTVNMGADGVTMYNNQRFEDPQGAVRYPMPLPSNPTAFNTAYLSWPWWIRSDSAGNVYVYDGSSVYAYRRDTTALWTVGYPTDTMTTLFINDDESAILLANSSTLIVLDPATGNEMLKVDYLASFGVDGCWAQLSPWAPWTPVPLPGSSTIAIVCTKKMGKNEHAMLATIDINEKTASQLEPLANASPGQMLFDSAGYAYALSVVSNTPSVQRIALPTPKTKLF